MCASRRESSDHRWKRSWSCLVVRRFSGRVSLPFICCPRDKENTSVFTRFYCIGKRHVLVLHLSTQFVGELIAKTLLETPLYQKSQVVAAYISAAKLREVDTTLLVYSILQGTFFSWLLAVTMSTITSCYLRLRRYFLWADEKACFVPRVLDSNSNLQFLKITNTKTDLVAVPPFGIEEPTETLPGSKEYVQICKNARSLLTMTYLLLPWICHVPACGQTYCMQIGLWIFLCCRD